MPIPPIPETLRRKTKLPFPTVSLQKRCLMLPGNYQKQKRSCLKLRKYRQQLSAEAITREQKRSCLKLLKYRPRHPKCRLKPMRNHLKRPKRRL